MSTIQQYIILFSFLISFVVISNYLIHAYYKNQQRIVEVQIKNKKYEIFKNIKLIQSWYFGIKLNRADLILIEDQMIVFMYNPIFIKRMKQAQPIILFYNKPHSQIINKGISILAEVKSIFVTETEFIIFASLESLFTSKEIEFKFNINTNQKSIVTEFLKENEYVA